MKFNTIVKLFTALAAAVGAVYIIATYGDKIVAWPKVMMDGCCSKHVVEITVTKDSHEETAPSQEEAPADEAAEEPTQEPAVEETTAEPVLTDDAIPVANEEDFEG